MESMSASPSCPVSYGRGYFSRSTTGFIMVASDICVYYYDYLVLCSVVLGKSSESVQCAMLKACDACADMGQL